jgi:hypothetical protein
MEGDAERFLRQLTEAVARARREAGFPDDIGISVERLAGRVRRIVLDQESARQVGDKRDAAEAEP